MALEVAGSGQVFRWIAPGVFLMGSPEGEPERWAERETQHEVTLSRGFWLADSACTQAWWRAVMGNNPSQFQTDSNHPVETVSWHDAQAFIAQLNAQVQGLQARLPTEAEWEYACRAGTTTPFSFGDNITPEQVNYDGNYPYAGGVKGQYREQTVPVKSLPPNPWGLYEMHGNVWEWCQDWFANFSPSPQQDPIGPLEDQYRVLRGGSWRSDGRFVRSANRDWDEPDFRDDDTGFRLALGPIGEQAQVPGPAAER
jgi:sulfatase modifying factor 1